MEASQNCYMSVSRQVKKKDTNKTLNKLTFNLINGFLLSCAYSRVGVTLICA